MALGPRLRAVATRLGYVLAAAVAVGVGWFLFGYLPARTSLSTLGVLLVLATVPLAVRAASRVENSLAPGYNAAEVTLTGSIAESSGGLDLQGPTASSRELVGLIDEADADADAEALVLTVNTTGGEPVASDDIRRAVRRFDGPTVTYVTKQCASGGYLIASGSDEIHARTDSLVGSIGMIGSMRKMSEFADMVGITYERFVAGEYKDFRSPFKALSDDEREYYQGILDRGYDNFVSIVSEGRDLDPETVRETEARIYHATEAEELGLVDCVGSREEMEERLAERAGLDELVLTEFAVDRGFLRRFGLGLQVLAHSFGSGVAGALGDDAEFTIELR